MTPKQALKRGPESAARRVKRNLLRAKKLVHSRLPGFTLEEQVAVLSQYCGVLEQALTLVCEATVLGRGRAKGSKK
jgi:hypothetical protein